MASIKGVSATRSVPTPRDRPQMVLGSRTPDMYSPRIKPMDAQRNYGKPKPMAGSDPSGIGFSSMLGGRDGRL